MKKIIGILLIVIIGCVDNNDELLINKMSDEFIELPTYYTVSTIGDSRFISSGGSLVRKAIKKNSSNNLIFVGSLKDKYGFSHDAVGGDGSPELMDRYDSIPPADIYVILFGTNDGWTGSIDLSLETISFITNDKLSQGSKVYYCKQTPRNDNGQNYHDELDEAVINTFMGVENFKVIDLRNPLLNEDGTFNQSLYSDHVHPNNDGGKIMGKEIANKIDE